MTVGVRRERVFCCECKYAAEMSGLHPFRGRAPFVCKAFPPKFLFLLGMPVLDYLPVQAEDTCAFGELIKEKSLEERVYLVMAIHTRHRNQMILEVFSSERESIKMMEHMESKRTRPVDRLTDEYHFFVNPMVLKKEFEEKAEGNDSD